MVDLDDVLVPPDGLIHLVHNAKGLIPYEFVIPLRRSPVNIVFYPAEDGNQWTHLGESWCRDFPLPFPFGTLGDEDVGSEGRERLIYFKGLREACSRSQDLLRTKHISVKYERYRGARLVPLQWRDPRRTASILAEGTHSPKETLRQWTNMSCNVASRGSGCDAPQLRRPILPAQSRHAWSRVTTGSRERSRAQRMERRAVGC